MSREIELNDGITDMSPAERDRAERVSALVDGELEDARYAGEVARDAAATAVWARYQNIGDMLRSTELAPTSRDDTFITRMRLSLAAEPLVVAPASHAALGAKLPPQARPLPAQGKMVGNGVNAFPLRTTAIVGGLAAAAIAAIGWSSFGPARTVQQAPAIELSQAAPAAAVATAAKVAAQAAEPASLVVVQTANGAVIRDARLDQYFAAHSGMRSGTGLGNGASMAAPATFVRSASFDSAAQQ